MVHESSLPGSRPGNRRAFRSRSLFQRASRPRVVLFAAAVWSLANSAMAQDWPIWRHDSQRTARQSLVGEIDVPAEQWSLPLGGSLPASQFLVEDVNRDGLAEVVVLRGGRAVASRSDGVLVWATAPLSISSLLAATDLDGNGRLEMVAVSYYDGALVLDGTTGSVLWRSPSHAGARYFGALALDVQGDGRLELYVPEWGCSMGGAGTGRVYGFPSGFGGAATEVGLDTSSHGYWCGIWQTAADVDGDGLPEIVAPGLDRVFVYSPRSGAQLFASPSDVAFPWAIAASFAADVDSDGMDEVVVASNNSPSSVGSLRALQLFELDGAAFSRRWIVSVDPASGVHVFPRSPIADLIPGGDLEISSSFFDGARGTWETVVIDGASRNGVPSLRIPGAVLLALSDTDGDGATEMLTMNGSGASVPEFGVLRLLRSSAGPSPTVAEVWRAESSTVALEPGPWDAQRRPVLVESAGGVWATTILRDLDSDGRSDSIGLLAPDGGLLAARSIGDAGGAAVGLRTLPFAFGAGLVATRTSGAIEFLDAALALTNDRAPPLGEADLREFNFQPGRDGIAFVRRGPAADLLLVDADARLTSYAVETAGAAVAPTARWRRPDRVADQPRAAFVGRRGGPWRAVSLVRADAGGLDVVVADPADGAEVLRAAVGDSPTSPTSISASWRSPGIPRIGRSSSLRPTESRTT
jgi:hypothetical protein